MRGLLVPFFYCAEEERASEREKCRSARNVLSSPDPLAVGWGHSSLGAPLLQRARQGPPQRERGREREREKRERERAPRRSHPQPWRKKEGESERPCRSKKRQPSPATTLCNFQLHRPRCSSRSRCDVRRGVGPVSEFQGRDTQWGWRRGK